jgi:hypothetical protein
MNRCKTCNHWTAQAPYGLPGDYQQRVCDSQKLIGGLYESESGTLSYEYDEGGCFYTGPEFGCVHHAEAQCQDQSQTKS